MDICLIPARGGSKRIPRKNIREFHGKPMISWAIEAARNSNCFDRIIVSTDDSEIADISMDSGAEVPFVRPASLSDDHATTQAVVEHAIGKIVGVTNLCCLYATTPFLLASDLVDGRELLDGSCDYVIPVTTFAYPVERSLKIVDNKYLKMLNPELYLKRSQDLDEMWHDAGLFYWGSASAWLSGKNPYDGIVRPLEISRKRVQDIDTEEDWDYAELMFNYLFPKRN